MARKRRLYAQDTEVSVSRSKAEIEMILTRYGADQFIYGVRDGEARVMFRAHGRHVKFVLPLPGPGNDREERRRWRCLCLAIKSKLEVVATGISEFENEFMSHIVMPDGRTVAEHARPMIASAYERGNMQPLLPDFTGGA